MQIGEYLWAFCNNWSRDMLFTNTLILSLVMHNVTNKLTCKFSGFYPKRGIFLWTLEIRRICMGRRGFALQSRSSGFSYKSL